MLCDNPHGNQSARGGCFHTQNCFTLLYTHCVDCIPFNEVYKEGEKVAKRVEMKKFSWSSLWLNGWHRFDPWSKNLCMPWARPNKQKKKSSHYKEKNLSLCVMMITNGYTYCGDGFTKYTNIKSLYCAPETDVLHVNYISTKKKKSYYV